MGILPYGIAYLNGNQKLFYFQLNNKNSNTKDDSLKNILKDHLTTLPRDTLILSEKKKN